MYNAEILDHNVHPYNKGVVFEATHEKQLHNASCGDKLTIKLRIEDNVITEVGFDGVGCAISQASADMMLDLLRDKTLDEARVLKEKFLQMIQTGKTTPELDEVNALADISKMPARVKCAELAWQILG